MNSLCRSFSKYRSICLALAVALSLAAPIYSVPLSSAAAVLPTDTSKEEQWNLPSNLLPGYVEDLEHYMEIPEELADHFLLGDRRNYGPCKTLTGNVVLTVLFVNQPDAPWTPEEIEQCKVRYENELEHLRQQAAEYQVDLQISLNCLETTVANVYNRDKGYDWTNEVLKAAGLPSSTEVTKHLQNTLGAKEVPIAFALNQSGRSHAVYHTSEKHLEYAILYRDIYVLMHEMLHLFGAEDLYYAKKVENAVKQHFPMPDSSVMLDSFYPNVDSLTAYQIGWTDKLADYAIAVLQETADITQEELDAEAERNTLTGEGTIDWYGGTYSGQLDFGIPNGSGTFNSDGITYQGNWLNGKYHGHGIESAHYTLAGNGSYEHNVTYEGEWKDGIKSGQGKETVKGKYTFEGTWQDGSFGGYGVKTLANGIVLEGEWQDGQLVDVGRITLGDGSVYEGEVRSNQAHGIGTITYADGSGYAGGWSFFDYNGSGTRIWSNGVSYEGGWKYNTFDQYGILTIGPGLTYEADWHEGKTDGFITVNYPNGHCKQITLADIEVKYQRQ